LILEDQNTADFILELIRTNSKPRLNKWVAHFFTKDTFWGAWLQLFVVHLQLTIVMGLCMDDGKSLTSRFLRTKVMQFLGRISLSLYLTHESMLGFVILAINGPQEYDTEAEIWQAYESGDLFEPPGSPLIVIITAPIVAFIVTKYFEEPITKILRGSK
jgi:peptidoglycan/LPS O-acetylase OafA/YrhL